MWLTQCFFVPWWIIVSRPNLHLGYAVIFHPAVFAIWFSHSWSRHKDTWNVSRLLPSQAVSQAAFCRVFLAACIPLQSSGQTCQQMCPIFTPTLSFYMWLKTGCTKFLHSDQEHKLILTNTHAITQILQCLRRSNAFHSWIQVPCSALIYSISKDTALTFTTDFYHFSLSLRSLFSPLLTV